MPSCGFPVQNYLLQGKAPTSISAYFAGWCNRILALTFKEWKKWIGDLPWLLRWFPLLLLVRPLIDSFYFLKEVSPFISPPYIAGVLTPLLCISAMVRLQNFRFTFIDKAFALWSILLLLNSLMLLFLDPLSLMTFEFFLKISMPVYLYFFIRLLVRDLRDLHGVLQTMLYSTIFVGLVLLFELFSGPVAIQESRGLTRIQGGFGDVVSYGMYIVFSTLIACYFYFSRQHLVRKSILIRVLMAVMVLGVAGLLNIHHTATYSTFMVLLALFLVYNFRTANRHVALGMILIGGLAFSIWGSTVIEERISPLLETDLAVYVGEKDYDQLFHGRMGRWRRMMDNYFEQPVFVQLFGMPLRLESAFNYIGVGSHNDFFRILFTTGAAGLLLYISLLWKTIRSAAAMGIAQRFLIHSGMLTLLLYSISVTPTFYPTFLYFILPVMAYAGLTETQRLSWNGHPY